MVLKSILLVLTACLAWSAPPPRRVVSHAVGTDDLVLALAEPGQIAALSVLGRDSRYSPHAAEASRFPALKRGEVEDILAVKPDLVVLASYSPHEVRHLLSKAGVRVFMVERFDTMDELCATALELGSVLGRESHARTQIAAWRSREDDLRRRLAGVKPVRVMAAGIYPFVSGARTTFQDICDHVGAINVVAEAGITGIVPIPNEVSLSWKIDLLIGPEEPGVNLADQLRAMAPYKFMSALKEGRLITIPGALLATTSHRRLDAYEAVARRIHPERFAPQPTPKRKP